MKLEGNLDTWMLTCFMAEEAQARIQRGISQGHLTEY